MDLQSDYPWRSRWRKTKHVCKVRIEGEKHLIFCDREVFEFSRLAGLKVPLALRQLHRVLFLEGSPLVVAKDSHREEVSRGEDNFVAGETRSVLKGGADVVFRPLRVRRQDLVRRLPCSQRFEDQVDRNAGADEARRTHHHIVSNFDVLWQVHSSTLAAISNSLKTNEAESV